MVKEVMRNNPDIEYEKVDIDERPDIVTEFSIQSVPTFVLFKDDMPVAFKSGRMAQKEFEGFLGIHEIQEG
jgi:thioredoxin-like negative regulator of GroEL